MLCNNTVKMTYEKNPLSSRDQSNESTGMKLVICIACQEAKLGSHWIQCTKDNCESWWHTSCAGLGDCNSKKIFNSVNLVLGFAHCVLIPTIHF